MPPRGWTLRFALLRLHIHSLYKVVSVFVQLETLVFFPYKLTFWGYKLVKNKWYLWVKKDQKKIKGITM